MSTADWQQRRVVLDAQRFHEALARFAATVGREHVVTEPTSLDAAGSATVPDTRAPAAILYPATASEVAKLVAIASQLGIPLWPCSRGRNWGYGSAAPFLGGTVLLHLERLNHIVEVNEELAYAVVEPGVTYRQLRSHLSQHH